MIKSSMNLWHLYPLFTAHSSSKEDSFEAQRPLRKDVFFWRIGERPILQTPGPAAIDKPETLRTFDLPRVLLGTNQKRFPLCDLRVSAVRVNNLMLSLIN
jgi:hypothetical protein